MKNSSIFICGAASVERVSIIIRSSTLLSVGFATMMFLPQPLKLVVLPCPPKSKLFSLIWATGSQFRWENGVSSPSQKDVASPMINANSKVATSQHAVAVESAGERKAATLRLEPNSWVHCGKETFLGSNPESK
ncbi:hypothetical protein V6N12_067038 [Hibiscus sabdariffa]|uniref:Uncharacterized protein n=1 Tax=Hibiscus sabdariffa TaxID=183260 RepID=A0ABR2BKM6_9ROSI